MKPPGTAAIAISVAVAIALASTSARAASLTGPVGGADAGAAGYTTATVPGYVSMYEYVPATPAAHPPVLVVSHWYAATAAGMFGVAQGGGLVSPRRTSTASSWSFRRGTSAAAGTSAPPEPHARWRRRDPDDR